jgi:HSP20 family protein
VGSWSPIRELDRLKGQFENILEGLAGSVESGLQRWAGVFPLINVSEDVDNLYVTAELPGVTVQDMEISVQGNNLTIRGERRIGEADRKVNYHRREREAGFFRRVVNLPVKTDHEKVRASFRDGILEIVLPKAAEARPRRIDIEML